MTVPEHRNEAQILTAEAAAERSKYDPDETRVLPIHDTSADLPDWGASSYNPTRSHLERADREMREAAAHVAAAHRLESFEDAHCRNIAPAERSACPLLASQVREVQETKDGVRLVFRDGSDVTATYLRLDCHLAYAVARGFERPSCPLFVKGISLTLELAGSGAIVMSADAPEIASTIRRQARRVFLGDFPVSLR